MRYLITGITGFAGPHLANLLAEEGHEVIALVRSSNGREDDIRDIVPDKNFSKIKFVYGDLTHSESVNRIFKEENLDGVFHLAAQSHPPTSFLDPIGTFETNANGTVNIANAIEKYAPDCKLMFCSTSEVYGNVPIEKGNITEDFPIAPMNPYGVSKAAADHYIIERARSSLVQSKLDPSKKPLQFFVTRAFSHTGPRRGHKFSISSDAYQIVKIKKELQERKIRVGNLESRRVVIDVRDCVKAYYMLMNKFTPGEAYNVGGDEVFSMDHFLNEMLKIEDLNGQVELYKDPELARPIDIIIQVCDTSKLRNLTGWKPEIPLEQTLRDLLNYWHRKISLN